MKWNGASISDGSYQRGSWKLALVVAFYFIQSLRAGALVLRVYTSRWHLNGCLLHFMSRHTCVLAHRATSSALLAAFLSFQGFQGYVRYFLPFGFCWVCPVYAFLYFVYVRVLQFSSGCTVLTFSPALSPK